MRPQDFYTGAMQSLRSRPYCLADRTLVMAQVFSLEGDSGVLWCLQRVAPFAQRDYVVLISGHPQHHILTWTDTPAFNAFVNRTFPWSRSSIRGHMHSYSMQACPHPEDANCTVILTSFTYAHAHMRTYKNMDLYTATHKHTYTHIHKFIHTHITGGVDVPERRFRWRSYRP